MTRAAVSIPFFEAIASRYDRAYALPAAESRRRMARVMAALPAAPARIIDLGVGTGRELSSLLDAGHQPTGVDGSPAMLARCARRSRPVPLVQADFWATLPFADAVFDAAIALHGTLAHPPEASSFSTLSTEIARLVRDGGRFIAEVPSPAWIDRALSMPPAEGRRVQRTGPRTCIYEDLVVGARIETQTLDQSEWRTALSPLWDAHIEPLDDLEWFIVAHRRAKTTSSASERG